MTNGKSASSAQEALKILLKTDREARDQVVQAEEAARARVDEARQEAEITINEVRTQAETEADELVRQAKEEAGQQAETLLQKTADDMGVPHSSFVDPEQFRQQAGQQMDQAADLLVAWVTAAEG